MAIEKKLKSDKKGKVEESPSNVFYDQVRGILDNYIKKREDKFKFSARWEYLKNELIKAAEHGGKRIIIRDTNKEFGKGRVYAEWEIDLFTDEYDWLMYYFDSKKNGWRIYWL